MTMLDHRRAVAISLGKEFLVHHVFPSLVTSSTVYEVEKRKAAVENEVKDKDKEQIENVGFKNAVQFKLLQAVTQGFCAYFAANEKDTELLSASLTAAIDVVLSESSWENLLVQSSTFQEMKRQSFASAKEQIVAENEKFTTLQGSGRFISQDQTTAHDKRVSDYSRIIEKKGYPTLSVSDYTKCFEEVLAAVTLAASRVLQWSEPEPSAKSSPKP